MYLQHHYMWYMQMLLKPIWPAQNLTTIHRISLVNDPSKDDLLVNDQAHLIITSPTKKYKQFNRSLRTCFSHKDQDTWGSKSLESKILDDFTSLWMIGWEQPSCR